MLLHMIISVCSYIFFYKAKVVSLPALYLRYVYLLLLILVQIV